MIRRVFGFIVLALGGRILWLACSSDFFGSEPFLRDTSLLYVFSGVLVAAGLWLMLAKSSVTPMQIFKALFGFLGLLFGLSLLGYIGYDFLFPGPPPYPSVFARVLGLVVAAAMIKVGWRYLRRPNPADESNDHLQNVCPK